MSSNLVCSQAGQFRWIAITWVNHIGTTLVNVVPISHREQAVSVGVGFSPVADAFGSDGSIDSANRLACPDGDLRLREDAAARQPLDPERVGPGLKAFAGSVRPISRMALISATSACARPSGCRPRV